MGEEPGTGSAPVTEAQGPEPVTEAQGPEPVTEAQGPEEVTEAQGPEEIQRDIEQTRQNLGDTVEALAEKTDIKAQAKRKLDDTKASVAAKKKQVLGRARDASPDGASTAATQASQTARENPLPLAAAAAFAFGFLAGRVSKD